jgi:hypothetical protein
VLDEHRIRDASRRGGRHRRAIDIEARTEIPLACILLTI